jgi:RNA polymerase sigma-70 factor (ECF subfamily)
LHSILNLFSPFPARLAATALLNTVSPIKLIPWPMHYENDVELFITLYSKYKETIYRQAFHLTSCRVNAEDIVQDVFLNLWKHKDHWAEIENIQAYLFFCTRNKTMDYFHRIKLERTRLKQLGEAQLLYDSPELKMEIQEAQQLHEAAIRQLPAQQRKVYTLRRVYGWKRKKIAKELNLSDNTVRKHMQQAIRSVKQFIIRETREKENHDN